MDVWIWMDAENAEKVVSALDDFGFRSLDIKPADLTTENTVIQLGYPPQRIDILTSIDGVEFDSCWARREHFQIDGRAVPFISVSDLVANKRASGRPQDLADVAILSERTGAIDAE